MPSFIPGQVKQSLSNNPLRPAQVRPPQHMIRYTVYDKSMFPVTSPLAGKSSETCSLGNKIQKVGKIGKHA